MTKNDTRDPGKQRFRAKRAIVIPTLFYIIQIIQNKTRYVPLIPASLLQTFTMLWEPSYRLHLLIWRLFLDKKPIKSIAIIALH